MSDVRAFFDEYREAFAAFDADALMAHFTFPMLVVSATEDGPSIFASTAEDWPGVLGGLFDAYRSLGVVAADPIEFEVTALTGDVATARVHWELRQADGSAVYDFTGIYTVVMADGAWRITAIAHDELPQLGAAMAGG